MIKQENGSHIIMKEKQKKTKSPSVRVINARTYDSDNGKTCHQCGQTTMEFSLTCKNYNEDKQCGTCPDPFQYGENVEEAGALDCEWKCPICRGICNCSRCMKERGCKPTGILSPIAEATGFPSVSEILHLEDCNSITAVEEDASSKKTVVSNEDPVAASSKRGRAKTVLDENHDSVHQSNLPTKRTNCEETLLKTSPRKIDNKADISEVSKKEYGALSDTIESDEKKVGKLIKWKPPVVRIKNGKIYDSENGKSCHQCRQKTTVFAIRCQNYKGNEQCALHFCQFCLLKRYGENAEEIAPVDCPWKCPRCRGVCNCSFCMKKKGCKPTGRLYHLAKANGYHSVSEMLGSDIKRLDEPSQEMNEASSEVKLGETHDAASSKRGRKKTKLGENHDAASSKRGRKKTKLGENHDAASLTGGRKKTKLGENHDAASTNSKKQRNYTVSTVTMSAGSSAAAENSKKRKKRYCVPKDTMDCDKAKVCKIIKRTKSPGVRIISGKVYDSENGKTCHQCRQKTLVFTVTCKNYINNKQCAIHFCQICLLNRYGENAAEVAALGCQWKCPKCRGVCNCCGCMKKRGHKPTGALFFTAKAKGYPSDSELLSLEDCRRVKIDASLKRSSSSNEVSMPTLLNSDETRIKVEISEDNTADERVNYTQLNVTHNLSPELFVGTKSNKEELSKEFSRCPIIKHQRAEDLRKSAENIIKFQINKEAQIALPPGNQLTKIANLELPAGDIGVALQFLEFCQTFGQVLNLRKEQPESLLQEIVCGQISGERCDFSADCFYMKLMSIIQRDSGRGWSLEEGSSHAWTEDLRNYISDSEFMSNELMEDSASWGLESYQKQSPSKKLRILTFLCDEALGTSELRNWIDHYNLKYVEDAKMIKIARKKLLDEIAADILQTTGKQLLQSENQNLVLKLKAEVIQTLNDKLNEMKKGMQSAVRLDPLLSDRNGRKFWKLRSYTNSGEMDVILQDVVTDGGFPPCKENWFGYDVQEKATVEKYIAGYLGRDASRSSSFLCPVLSVKEH